MKNDLDESLIGSWKLVSLEVHSPTGEISRPMGAEPHGWLTYDREGYMSLHIMRPGRRSFEAEGRMNGTFEELREAFGGYLAYWGRYTVDSRVGSVTHTVIGSLYPNWIGTEQLRRVELSGDRLRMTTQPMPIAGQPQTTCLVWQRVGAPSPSEDLPLGARSLEA